MKILQHLLPVVLAWRAAQGNTTVPAVTLPQTALPAPIATISQPTTATPKHSTTAPVSITPLPTANPPKPLTVTTKPIEPTTWTPSNSRGDERTETPAEAPTEETIMPITTEPVVANSTSGSGSNSTNTTESFDVIVAPTTTISSLPAPTSGSKTEPSSTGASSGISANMAWAIGAGIFALFVLIAFVVYSRRRQEDESYQMTWTPLSPRTNGGTPFEIDHGPSHIGNNSDLIGKTNDLITTADGLFDLTYELPSTKDNQRTSLSSYSLSPSVVASVDVGSQSTTASNLLDTHSEYSDNYSRYSEFTLSMHVPSELSEEQADILSNDGSTQDSDFFNNSFSEYIGSWQNTPDPSPISEDMIPEEHQI